MSRRRGVRCKLSAWGGGSGDALWRATVVISGVFPWRIELALVGRSILEAKRKGKNLWLRLDEPPFPSFQFGRLFNLKFLC
jgi:hypothetical protein